MRCRVGSPDVRYRSRLPSPSAVAPSSEGLPPSGVPDLDGDRPCSRSSARRRRFTRFRIAKCVDIDRAAAAESMTALVAAPGFPTLAAAYASRRPAVRIRLRRGRDLHPERAHHCDRVVGQHNQGRSGRVARRTICRMPHSARRRHRDWWYCSRVPKGRGLGRTTDYGCRPA